MKFINKIFIVSALLGFYNNTLAQLSIEPSSGIALSNFIIDPATGPNVSEFKIGFRLGVNLNFGVGRNGFFGSGFQYVQKGDKSSYDDSSQTIYLRYNNLTLPIIYKNNLLSINKVKLQGFGGCYVGVLVGQRVITDYGQYKWFLTGV